LSYLPYGGKVKALQYTTGITENIYFGLDYSTYPPATSHLAPYKINPKQYAPSFGTVSISYIAFLVISV
jgi:hypothetical protein